jgi:hypothetical protein
MVVALIEATIGWYISWQIGPGRPANVVVTPSYLSRSIASVALIGAVIGAGGAVLSLGLRNTF